ncbi:MAG UNVERIFIED_CONTAM: hypothetical protein LVR18_15285 [Planctomycetaceae bacterium]
MRTRNGEELVASGQIIGMDLYIPKWGVRGVGIRGIYVPETRRRYGYAQSLVYEICRCLPQRVRAAGRSSGRLRQRSRRRTFHNS